MSKQKFALALGGGAARGWAHIGILHGLAEAGLEPEIVVGTSIGAIVGGHYAAGRLDVLEDFARELTRRPPLRMFPALLLSSILSANNPLASSMLTTSRSLFAVMIPVDRCPVPARAS